MKPIEEDYDAHMDRMAQRVAAVFDAMNMQLTEVCYVCAFLMASAIEQMHPELREATRAKTQEFFNRLMKKEHMH